jgi:hypothetical protein
MNRTVEGLIGEIRGLANGRIDSTQLEEVTEEVRAHLDAGIQARLELGLTPEAAEEEVVRGFGDPVKVIDDLAPLHPSRKGFALDRGLTIAFLVSSGALSIFIAVGGDEGMSNTAGFVYLALWIASLALVAKMSWQARRLQVLPLVIATVFSTLLFAAIQEPNYSADALGSFTTPLSNKNLNKDLLDSFHKDRASRQQEKEFGSRHQQFLESLAAGGPMLVPELKVGPTSYRFTDTSIEKMVDLAGHDSELIYVPAPSMGEAERTWAKAVPAALQIFQFDQSRISSSVMQDSMQTMRPAWLNFFLLLPNSFFTALSLVVMLGAAHIIAVFARFVSSRRKPGPRLA